MNDVTRAGLRNDRLKGSHVECASRIGGEVEDLQYLVRQPDVKGGESGKSMFGARRVHFAISRQKYPLSDSQGSKRAS